MKRSERKWKSDKKLPRIIKINSIRGFVISVLFSDGSNRTLDFSKIFRDWNITKRSPEYKLLDLSQFKKVQLGDHTLVWNNIQARVKGLDNKLISLPYQIGADVLYELSEPDLEEIFVGAMIRRERLKAGLSQEDLGKRIGSDKHYISKVEADKFHIEISTLKKIVEGGLHKKLEIIIK